MSLEQALTANTEAMTALAAVMEKMIHNQEGLLAGQQAALEKVAAGNPDKPTRGRPKKAETEAVVQPEKTDTPPTSEKPADTESGEQSVATAADAADAPAAPPFKDVSKKWLDKAEKGTDEHKKRGVAIMGILGHFGAGKMSELKPEDEDKAMFFLKRHVKGLPVNYDAPYDFAGDPLQDEPEVSGGEAAAEDDDDLFG
jgi:hypothetical protein